MPIDRNLLDKIRNRGEEVLTQLSAELMSNPRFVKAIEGAMRGREKIEQAAVTALKEMNVPTRGDLSRANSRIEALEREIAELRGRTRQTRRTASKPPARRSSAASASAARKKPARAPVSRRTKARAKPGGAE